jgi:hypothetical protein
LHLGVCMDLGKTGSVQAAVSVSGNWASIMATLGVASILPGSEMLMLQGEVPVLRFETILLVK